MGKAQVWQRTVAERPGSRLPMWEGGGAGRGLEPGAGRGRRRDDSEMPDTSIDGVPLMEMDGRVGALLMLTDGGPTDMVGMLAFRKESVGGSSGKLMVGMGGMGLVF